VSLLQKYENRDGSAQRLIGKFKALQWLKALVFWQKKTKAHALFRMFFRSWRQSLCCTFHRC